MQKALAIFSGVVAAITIAAGGAYGDPDHRDRGGDSDHRERGDGPRGGGSEMRPPQAAPYYGDRPTMRGGYPGGPGGYRNATPPTYEAPYTPPQRRLNSLGSAWREQQEEARSGVRQGQMAPLGSVIAGIGHRSSGRPLDAGIEYQGARAVYRVRWLTNDGRRVDYLVDAATGQILSEH